MPKFKGKPEGQSEPNYKEGNLSRAAQEEREGGFVSPEGNTAPKNRFQNEQQAPRADAGVGTTLPSSGFVKKSADNKGSALKQEVASKVLLSDSDYAGGPVQSGAQSLGKAGLVSMQFSGDAGTILGSAANIPVVGSNRYGRSEGRFEKKLDATSKKINYLASEQVISQYDNPMPLGESGNKKQGYYGTPKNTSVRSQKAEPGNSADLLTERSADILTSDMVVWVNGQYVKNTSNNITWSVEPTTSTSWSNADGKLINEPLTGDNAITYGNWANRCMKVIFAKDADGDAAYVSAISFTSVDLSQSEPNAVVNASSTNWIIDADLDEIARQNIDAKAGQETEPQWSPLGRAVAQPTATVGLLSRMESDLGANVFTSYKMGKKAYAYQLNKAAKDGQRITTPRAEMLEGVISSNISSKDYSDIDPFKHAGALAAGSAAMLIAIQDSTLKYSTKADVLLQPKSLRKAFQVADNNMNQFRLKKEFAAALNAVDVFSTIDRDYDPLAPVCVTDRIGLISPISYARFGDGTRANKSADWRYSNTVFTYAYRNRMSKYSVQVKHPLLEGIREFCQQYAESFYRELAGSSAAAEKKGACTWTVPILSSTTCFSAWDFLVLYSVPFMQRVRINSMRDVLDYEDWFEYPFRLDTIANLNPMNAVNYNINDIDSPLESRRMIPSTAVRWYMPELFWKVNDNQFVMPWYFSEWQLTPGAAHGGSENPDYAQGYSFDFDSGVMNFPVLRSGVRLSFADNLYGMEERDIRLCLDRLVRPPQGSANTQPYNVYKYGQSNDGCPVVGGTFTIQQYLSTPRELGWFANAPHGWLRVMDNLVANKEILGFEAFAEPTTVMNGDSSFRLRCYKGVKEVSNSILTQSSLNISRGQAFRQYWDESPAVCMAKVGSTDKTYVTRPYIGMSLGLGDVLSKFTPSTGNATFVQNLGSFTPFTLGSQMDANSLDGSQTQSKSTSLSILAMFNAFWGRLQKLPMAISPWDICDSEIGSAYIKVDPYDFMYLFNCAGFMSSDYNQDLYDRTMLVQAQGYLYQYDPFVQDSPVFRDSIKYTM